MPGAASCIWNMINIKVVQHGFPTLWIFQGGPSYVHSCHILRLCKGARVLRTRLVLPCFLAQQPHSPHLTTSLSSDEAASTASTAAKSIILAGGLRSTKTLVFDDFRTKIERSPISVIPLSALSAQCHGMSRVNPFSFLDHLCDFSCCDVTWKSHPFRKAIMPNC